METCEFGRVIEKFIWEIKKYLVSQHKFFIRKCSRTNRNIETGLSRTIMQASLIIISIAVGRRTSGVDQVDILGSFNGSSSALFRADRWGRTT